MSEQAYERFMASYLLNPEESLPENRQEIIDLTEEVLDAKGIECDEKIDKMSEEDIKEILEEVRSEERKSRQSAKSNQSQSQTMKKSKSKSKK
jgi:rRNA pseudouridine-1189 N-methylase Emg1 (Nep1/Mra1 family)